MATSSPRAGRAMPGVLIGSLALLAFSAAALTGCSSKDADKPAAGKPGATAGAPKGGPTPDAGKTTDAGKARDADKTPAAGGVPDAGKTPVAAGATPPSASSGPLAYVPKDAYAFVLVRPKRIFGSELVKLAPPEFIED